MLPALIGGLLAATAFCGFCIIASVVLWFRGMWSIVEWWYWSISVEGEDVFDERKGGAVMPGAYGRDGHYTVWNDAKKIVEV